MRNAEIGKAEMRKWTKTSFVLECVNTAVDLQCFSILVTVKARYCTTIL